MYKKINIVGTAHDLETPYTHHQVITSACALDFLAHYHEELQSNTTLLITEGDICNFTGDGTRIITKRNHTHALLVKNLVGNGKISCPIVVADPRHHSVFRAPLRQQIEHLFPHFHQIKHFKAGRTSMLFDEFISDPYQAMIRNQGIRIDYKGIAQALKFSRKKVSRLENTLAELYVESCDRTMIQTIARYKKSSFTTIICVSGMIHALKLGDYFDEPVVSFVPRKITFEQVATPNEIRMVALSLILGYSRELFKRVAKHCS